MSFFGNIFGGSSANSGQAEFWNKLESEEDLKNAIQTSYEKPVVLFKHSTRCIISRTVLRNFEREIQNLEKDVEYYFLDLLAHRDISNAIEEKLEVHHQSPQMILLRDGEVQKSASHHSISASHI